MAITTAMSTSYKKELLEAVHNHKASGGDAFKLALFKASVTGSYGAATTSYTDMTGNSDEVANGSGYTTGGAALTNVDPSISGTTALTDFSNDPQWTTATFNTDGAMIYNNTEAGKNAVEVHNFGSTKSVSNGTLTVQFPVADASNAIIRIA